MLTESNCIAGKLCAFSSTCTGPHQRCSLCAVGLQALFIGLRRSSCRGLGEGSCASRRTLAGWVSVVAKAGENGGRGIALSLKGRFAPRSTYLRGGSRRLGRSGRDARPHGRLHRALGSSAAGSRVRSAARSLESQPQGTRLTRLTRLASCGATKTALPACWPTAPPPRTRRRRPYCRWSGRAASSRPALARGRTESQRECCNAPAHDLLLRQMGSSDGFVGWVRQRVRQRRRHRRLWAATRAHSHRAASPRHRAASPQRAGGRGHPPGPKRERPALRMRAGFQSGGRPHGLLRAWSLIGHAPPTGFQLLPSVLCK